jgi:hypothetical protein
MLNSIDLANFYGTENYYQYMFNCILTDGTKYVADNGGTNGAYWLMDVIGSYQGKIQKSSNRRLKEFQLWILQVNQDKTATIACYEDSGMEPFIKQNIEYTDFDLPEFKLYVSPMYDKKNNMVIMLPSER